MSVFSLMLKRLELRTLSVLFFSSSLLLITHPAKASEKTPPASADGIPFPEDYSEWQVVGVSHREDNKTLRAILGNDIAIQAIRDNQTNPWPDGAVLGKLVWKDRKDMHWEAATVPGEFVHAEFMFKDAEKWKDTGGWGWARWLGKEQTPFGNTPKEAHGSCVSCHTPVKGQDWVFTKPAFIPSRMSGK